ncbi:MAG: Arc family DNA-binding protein [Burkholderiaceae bacterium]|nr:Arc family DNA-binding protein [Burkholderiaceae bacterium]
MATLSIKDVPEEILVRLRERAARNHRSLQGELMSLISEAVRPAGEVSAGLPTDAGAPWPHLGAGHHPGGTLAQVVPPTGIKSVAQIAREHRARFPRPLAGGALAVDILRAERDAR